LPLQVDDLSKITLDWLAQYIPKDMLTKIEEERLKEEGKNPGSMYMPDSKTAIYDFIGKSDFHEPDNDYRFEYEEEAGNKQIITFGRYGMMRLTPIYLDKENRDRMTKEITVNWRSGTKSMLLYAMLLDDIFGTNFQKDLACDYGEFIRKPKSAIIFSDEYEYGYLGRDFAAKSKLFKNLSKSYKSIAKECKKTESSFRANEYANRRAFYEKSRFREEMKQSPDNQNANPLREGIQQQTNEQEKQEEQDI